MQNQNKKILRLIFGGGMLSLFLCMFELLIAKSISNNNPEVYEPYTITMISITMSIYLIISVISLVKYQKYAKNYEQKKIEKAIKELTSEFKPVLLKHSGPIPENLFQCKAKIGDDGKIICKIQLDHELKIESYEKFLEFFQFSQQ